MKYALEAFKIVTSASRMAQDALRHDSDGIQVDAERKHGAPITAMGLMDVADTRDMLDMENALRPVFKRMNLVNEDLRLALEARRAKCGAEAMNVYAAAKRLAAGQRAPGIATRVDQMREVMPQGKGPRKKKLTTEPAPASGE